MAQNENISTLLLIRLLEVLTGSQYIAKPTQLSKNLKISKKFKAARRLAFSDFESKKIVTVEINLHVTATGHGVLLTNLFRSGLLHAVPSRGRCNALFNKT